MRADAPFYSDVCDAPDGFRAWWLQAADGVEIRATTWTGGNSGTAFIFPGRTEYCEKYAPVVRELVDRDMSVVVIDWRGQGLSYRFPGSEHQGHVGHFQEYQLDVAAVMDLAAHLDLPKPFRMVAHSMGGCIGLRSIQERADFSDAVLSAPMWQLQFGTSIRAGLSKAGLASGKRVDDALTGQPDAKEGFEDNVLTSDRRMYELAATQIERHPDLVTGPPSVKWTLAAFREMFRLAMCPLPQIPVLTFLGTDELVVSQSTIKRRMARMPNGKLVMCPNGRHEVFVETPEIRTLIWSHIDRFPGNT